MQDQELDMESLIPAAEAARMLGIPASTLNVWLRQGRVAGRRSVTGRRYIWAREMLRILQERGFGGSDEERAVRERLAARQGGEHASKA